MAFARPSLTDLINQASSEIEASLPGSNPRARRSVLNTLARVIAGGVHGIHGNLIAISRSILPDTAEGDVLVRQASFRGLKRLPAQPAAGWIKVTGDTDTVVQKGSEWRRPDGQKYQSVEEVRLASNEAFVPVKAVVPGKRGNTAAGIRLSAVSPVFGLAGYAVIDDVGFSGGRDLEDDESLRARLLAVWRRPPRCGSHNDYIAWVQEVTGATRVWVYPEWNGPGSVGITFLHRDGHIPSDQEVFDVQVHVERRRPVTARIAVFPPATFALKPRIEITPDTQSVRDAIIAELRDFLLRDSAPGGKILLSRLREAVSIAVGEEDNIVHYPTADIQLERGTIAVLNGVEWVEEPVAQ